MKNEISIYQSVITDIKDIISSGRELAYTAANRAMVFTYWHIGKRIVEQEQNGNERAEYGKALMDVLSNELTKEYGKVIQKETFSISENFILRSRMNRL